jgi:hypothetical protein
MAFIADVCITAAIARVAKRRSIVLTCVCWPMRNRRPSPPHSSHRSSARPARSTKLDQAREQVFYGATTAELAALRQDATSSRERLIRLLGLWDAELGFRMPSRLPALPRRPLQLLFTFDAPSAEAPEHAVPIPERFRKITPGRACTHNPQHTFHEHPVVAAGRTLLVGSTDNQRRHPPPRRVAQNQTVLHTLDCLPKSSLESDLLLKGNP